MVHDESWLLCLPFHLQFSSVIPVTQLRLESHTGQEDGEANQRHLCSSPSCVTVRFLHKKCHIDESHVLCCFNSSFLMYIFVFSLELRVFAQIFFNRQPLIIVKIGLVEEQLENIFFHH
jgi:hypothetical protein